MIQFDGKPKIPLPVRREDYYYFGRYKAPLLYYALLQNWADDKDNNSSLPVVKGQIAALDGHQYILQSDWDIVGEKTIEALEGKNEKFFLEYFERAERACERLRIEAEEMGGTGDATQRFEELFSRIHELQYPWYLLLPMAQAGEDWLRKKGCADNLRVFFTPSRTTLLAQYQRSLQDIANLIDADGLRERFEKASESECMRMIEENGELKRAFEGILDRFLWVGMMHFWGERNSYEKIIDGIRHSMSSNTDVIRPLKYGEDLDWIVPIMQELTYFRQHFAELCAIETLRLHGLFSEYGISHETALYLTPGELIAYIDGKKGIRQEIIQERKNGFGLFNSIVTGPELQELLSEFSDTIIENQEIRGAVAFKGCVTGIARIILSPADMGKMKVGEILVAHETTPDVLPVMYRAVAFVTDVGGLTSHAAIVAREMKKPCIIGTKIATQVLKDGMLVEVDAEKGVVIILEQN